MVSWIEQNSAEWVAKPAKKRKLWTEAEDDRLKRLVLELGVKQWDQIAKQFDGRDKKAVTERYRDYLRPGINHAPLTEEECYQIVSFQAIHGNNWSELNKQMPDRTPSQIRNFWRESTRAQHKVDTFLDLSKETTPSESSKKRYWTQVEDNRLKELVGQFGVKKWSHLAKQFEGRRGKDLNERYCEQLRPGIAKGRLTLKERVQVISFQSIHGNKWSKLIEKMPGRTACQIRSFWHFHSHKKDAK